MEHLSSGSRAIDSLTLREELQKRNELEARLKEMKQSMATERVIPPEPEDLPTEEEAKSPQQEEPAEETAAAVEATEEAGEEAEVEVKAEVEAEAEEQPSEETLEEKAEQQENKK